MGCDMDTGTEGPDDYEKHLDISELREENETKISESEPPPQPQTQPQPPISTIRQYQRPVHTDFPMSMRAPDFDEEDLINDYVEDMEDDMEEPDPDDLIGVSEQTQQRAPQQSLPPPPPLTTDIAGDDHNAWGDEEQEPPAQVRQSFAQREQRRSTEDLFVFKRYDGASTWRTLESSSPTRARSSKPREQRTLFPKLAAKSVGATKAADAQLLRFQHPFSQHIHKKRMVELPTLPSPGSRQQTMTLSDGTRVCIEVEETAVIATDYDASDPKPLGISVGDLLERVQQIRRRQEHQKSVSFAVPMEAGPTSKRKANLANQLWVDKHAPTKFAHLLSDERTNRNVLRALRAWDPYVFHKALLPQPEFGQKHMMKEKDVKVNQNDSRPPEAQRVILLSGPPGVGKTTLAHIVAGHVGYRVMEVNGSDDRSSNALQERILSAMEQTLQLDGSSCTKGKPNCLVLDEIDGADHAAIQTIVNLVRADLPSKGQRRHSFLKRPLILICNNRYAPSLKPLWPYCRHFFVNAPRANRLVERLRSVLVVEKMVAPSSLLHQLVVQNNGDIRSSLNMLQYAATTALSNTSATNDEPLELTRDLAATIGVGVKDARNDLVGLLTHIFRKEKPVKGKSRATKWVDSTTSVLNRVDSLSESVAKVFDALLENVLSVSYIDPTLDRCAAAHEWMSLAMIGGGVNRVASTSAGALHLLCRVEKPSLIYSTRTSADNQYNRESNRQLQHRFGHGLSLQAKSYDPSETIPYGLWILSAGSGTGSLDRVATSVEILSPLERKSFDAHVSTLQTLGLTYKVQQDEDNTTSSSIALDPPINALVSFSALEVSPTCQRKEIPAAMKELLAQRSAYVKLRESNKENSATSLEEVPAVPVAKAVESQPKNTETPESTKRPSESPSSSGKRRKTVTAQNFLGIQARKSKQMRSARTAARVGMTKKRKKESHTGSQALLSEVVRLKYVKGFTQAVRAPCKLSDL